MFLLAVPPSGDAMPTLGLPTEVYFHRELLFPSVAVRIADICHKGVLGAFLFVCVSF